MRRWFPFLLVFLIACGPFFYQAPPSLGTYPERVATKPWHRIFEEASPPDPALPAAPALDEACRRLPQTLAPLCTNERLSEIGRLLSANRNGPYSAARANFLHELRELAADEALYQAAGTYVEWRALHDTKLQPPPPEARPWDMEQEEFDRLHALYQSQLEDRRDDLRKLLADAPQPLKPYWQTRLGAFFFAVGDFPSAAGEFSAVIESFPNTPRAEVSRLMLARCGIEQARVLRRAEEPAEDVDEQIQSLLTDAEAVLHAFIADHPKGRFTPDAEGWLGAIAFDRQLFGAAVSHQLARLDLQPTREITRTVLRECDFIFETLLNSQNPRSHDIWLDPEENFDAAAIARHPLVARLYVQHCIDPASGISLPLYWDDGFSGDRATIDFLKRRIFNPGAFVKASLAALVRELAAKGGELDATTLTLLAWSAAGDGENEQALALLEQIPPAARTDESLQARAIVLQRLGRHVEAVQAFDVLVSAYPGSPLAVDLPYRRSVSLFKSGDAGRAVLQVLPLVNPPAEDRSSGPVSLYPDSQLRQWLDTLIQFAPLDQLESACAELPPSAAGKRLLNDIIRTRALAARRFDLAGRHLSTGDSPGDEQDWEYLVSGIGGLGMTPADWEKRARPLAGLYSELSADPPASQRARLHLDIARHWMAARGSLTLPSLGIGYYAQSEREKQELLRRRNALELGFAAGDVQAELDHRDEATHALEHALKAAESSDPAVAAPALELANQCLFRRAEFSLYQKSRALEAGDTGLSKDLYQQLRSRFPETIEAKRAVWFTFLPNAGPWMPGDYNVWHSASAALTAMFGEIPEDEEGDGDGMAKLEAIPNRFINPDPKLPLARIRRDLAQATKEIEALRPLTDPENQGDVIRAIDRLDDLQAAASLRDVRAEDFRNYANGRFDKLPPAFESLLAFRKLLKTSVDADGSEQAPPDDTILNWREFLIRYPDSPKAEAASFRLTRLIARQYRTSQRIAAFAFPDAPIPGGYKHLKVVRTDPANDPESVLAAIDDHEQRFPAGRYRDDLNQLKAGALIDSGKYRDALVLVDSILRNPAQRDLHMVATLQFMDIAQRLLDPEHRASAAKAIRRTPGAIPRLRLLVDGDTFLSRLQPLMPWLEGE